ncbi:sensor domain-containing diguanylate cyclase [Rhodopseudomonas sp. BR0M22]|uniref:sensor domain-containing diguanylate cyclase n=2 Tax=unclassified Rhodopseudomonas TaxID=2638247 RepID=UPI0013DF9416|nr:sensor domain-containing diguanylate cyclase [Rhodopseudomonas sp. BR0M22]NEW94006.1 diguanylate cyclase [Rhodopseudomonas sp. BR0M22]
MARYLESQLDFIFFFYGLAFMLLGALCLAFARRLDDDHRPLIRLTGLFGCVHGASEWLDMSALLAGDASEFLLARGVLMTASFVLLAEAGRQGLQSRGLPVPGPWIFIPVLLVIVAVGVLDGVWSAKAVARYLLAAPGAIAVGFALYSLRADYPESGRWLMAAVAAGFIGYGLAAGVIVAPAPFWPADIVNQENFQRLTGVPIQLVRGLLAVMLAALAWTAWGRRVMQTLDYPGYSRHLKRQFIGVLTSLLGVLLLGWVLTNYLGEIHRQDTESEVAGDAVLLVGSVEREIAIADALVKVLANSPSVQPLLGKGRSGGPEAMRELLDLEVGALRPVRASIVDRSGNVVLSSNSAAKGWLGQSNLSAVGWFVQAIEGRAAREFRVDAPERLRTYLTAYPIRSAEDTIEGVAVLEVSLEDLAATMTRFDQAFFVLDRNGVVIITNRSDEFLRTLWPRPDLPLLRLAEQLSEPQRPTMLPREVFGGGWMDFGGRRSYVLRQRIADTQASLVVAAPVRGIMASRLLGIFITLQVAIAVLFYFFGLDSGVRDRLQRQLHEELQLRSRDLARQAATDALTGLFNRMTFNERLDSELARSERSGQVFSLIIFDIDYFKEVNDVYGHPMGDQVLIRLSQTVAASVRRSDLLVRWGGEEFALLLADTDAQAAYETAKKLRLLVSHTIFEQVGTVTASFGVAQVLPGDNAETLVARADNALYRAKLNGRNRVELSLSVVDPLELSPTL